jgi:hypothetical protein
MAVHAYWRYAAAAAGILTVAACVTVGSEFPAGKQELTAARDELELIAIGR